MGDAAAPFVLFVDDARREVDPPDDVSAEAAGLILELSDTVVAAHVGRAAGAGRPDVVGRRWWNVLEDLDGASVRERRIARIDPRAAAGECECERGKGRP